MVGSIPTWPQLAGRPRYSLLAFTQHYKTEVTKSQKDSIRALLRAHPHPAVTPEIRRELQGSRSRGDPFIPHLAGGSRPDDGDAPMHE